jgi:DNA-binding response OmpR family regulator
MNNGPKILVVEDSYFNQVLVEALLIDWGYNPIVCTKADEALEIMSKETIKLIILDLMLPGMDGFTFLSEKKNLNNQVPVIVMSAKNDASTIERTHNLGASHFISKPINSEILSTIITNYLNQQKH